MRSKTILKLGNCKVIETLYTKGVNIGDYFFTVYKDGQFVERFGNRMGNAALELCKSLSN